MDKEQAIKLAQRYKAAVAERLPLCRGTHER